MPNAVAERLAALPHKCSRSRPGARNSAPRARRFATIRTGAIGYAGTPVSPDSLPRRRVRVALGALLLLSPTSAAADAPAFEGAVDAQYYAPIHDDRSVRSVFVDVAVGKMLVPLLGLSAYAGLTFTHAWGSIVQLGEGFQPYELATSAVGVGPMGLVRIQPLRLGPVAAGLDAVGSLIVYDKHFPPGGDVYNFSWRIGPSVGVALGERLTAVAGFRWMHVSNGQGLGPQNPSYEGRGPSLGVVAGF